MKTLLDITVVGLGIGYALICYFVYKELTFKHELEDALKDEEKKYAVTVSIIFDFCMFIAWFEYWFMISIATHGLWYNWLGM